MSNEKRAEAFADYVQNGEWEEEFKGLSRAESIIKARKSFIEKIIKIQEEAVKEYQDDNLRQMED